MCITSCEECDILLSICKEFKPNLYVELGVRTGITISEIAKYANRAIGIDINLDKINMDLISNNIELIKCSTLDYVEKIKHLGEFIDVLFIDADHSCDAVLKDFESYFPFVKSGTGLIFLYDTHPIKKRLLDRNLCNDAYKAAEILKKRTSEKYEICTLPGPVSGITIIRKLNEKYVSWMN